MTSNNKRKQKPTGFCYLLHFTSRYPNGNRPQHYLGWAKSLKHRLRAHLAGRGARLTQVVQKLGITWEVVAVWPDASPELEKQLKRRHNHKHYCPVCAGKIKEKAAGSDQLPPALITPRLKRTEINF